MRVPIALVVVLTLLAACARHAAFHDAYLDAHPGWAPAQFPHEGADLAETLAAIHAPPQGSARTTLQGVRVFDVTQATWIAIPLDRLVPGAPLPDPGRSHLVLAHVACAVSTLEAWLSNDAVSSYLLVRGRLVDWRQHSFDRRCQGTVDRSRATSLPVPYRNCLDELAPKIGRGQPLPAESCGAVPVPGR